MARPQATTNATILAAACKLFLERGYQASTAAIAKEAGVSEGTIFKRFATKDELFFEALAIAPLVFSPEAIGAMERGELRGGAKLLAQELLRFFQHELLPRLMMLWAHPEFTPQSCFSGPGMPPPVVMVRRLSELFAAATGAGPEGADRVEVQVAARAFMAAIHQYAFFTLVGVQQHIPLAEQDYLDGLIEFVCRGLGRSCEVSPGVGD